MLRRIRFRIWFLFAIPLTFCVFVLLVAATTYWSTLSNKLELDDGRVLQVRHIKRHELPFTNRWLRRDLEILITTPADKEKVVAHRVSSHKLPDEDLLLMVPEIELVGPNQIQVSLIDRATEEVEHTMVLPIPDEE